MTILRVGSNEKYASNWDEAFGKPKKKAAKKTAAKKKTAKKKSGKKKLIIFAAIGIVLLAGAGAGVYFSGLLGGEEQTADGADGEAAVAPVAASAVVAACKA